VWFRKERDKEEKMAEAVGLTWKWVKHLCKRGKDAREFPTALAGFVIRAVRSGRRVCGQERSRDVLSPVGQRRHSFYVGTLPDFSTLSDNPLAEALHDNTRSPVPDQVCFRLDFPAWLQTLSQRNRRIALRMIEREKTQVLARAFGTSEGRISQLRREFHHDWLAFHGESA
jgi:hypothetical protein